MISSTEKLLKTYFCLKKLHKSLITGHTMMSVSKSVYKAITIGLLCRNSVISTVTNLSLRAALEEYMMHILNSNLRVTRTLGARPKHLYHLFLNKLGEGGKTCQVPDRPIQ